jgi:glucosamine--fructose-6-phosphate aminotransferase (isomerizing)
MARAAAHPPGRRAHQRSGKQPEQRHALPAAQDRHGPHPLGHARRANEINAHPHTDDTGRIALVHNGIIENYVALKQFLTAKGHTFTSQTDTEVLAVLIGDLYNELKPRTVPAGVSVLQRAVQAALHEVEGTYGIAVICKDEPDTLVSPARAAR